MLISKRQVLSVFLPLMLLSSFVLIGCIENVEFHSNNWNPSFSISYLITVTYIIDGDTIKAEMPNGSIDTIRFLGIDTPELDIENNNLYEYGSITDMSCLTTFGFLAKEYIESILNHTSCHIIFDKQAGTKDQYDRWLCYVFTNDGVDINGKLLEEGFARVYISETFDKKEEYTILQNNAMQDKIGLWDCS